jgi:putative oxygen-independent coproporphyrinogen III oxidase
VSGRNQPTGEVHGVYVHFPWCLQKCPYCDFVSFAAPRADLEHERYAAAVLAELAHRGVPRAETIFFGGGTPSLWEPRALGRVLRALTGGTPRTPGADEVTVECNPSSLDAERARALVAEGVTRLSVGVQSLDRERLAHLGRLHDAGGAFTAVRAAVASGARVSADLIYGVATDGRQESPEEAASEARRLAELGIGHVSAYALTIEPNTEFGARARAGRLPLLSDAVMAESFEAVGEALVAAGLERYEVSNYARPGDECRHNLGYWRGRDYLGLGCAAVGTVAGVRYRNPPNAERYLERAEAGDFTPHEREELSPETQLRERLMLGLRMREGVDLARARDELGVDPWTRERTRDVERLVADGRIERDGERLRIPEAHWLFADGIAAALF